MDPVLLSAASLVISVLIACLLGLIKFTAGSKDAEFDRRFRALETSGAQRETQLSQAFSAINQHSVDIQRTQGRIDVVENSGTNILRTVEELKTAVNEMYALLRDIQQDIHRRGPRE